MSKKSVLALAAAGIVAAFAGQAFAKLNGTIVPLACKIASKEFAGPVEVQNTTTKTIASGKVLAVVVKTAEGNRSESITLTKPLLPGAIVKGTKTYEDTINCVASVFYPKVA
jgi:hypothetical protein